jgi:hypothetical protein
MICIDLKEVLLILFVDMACLTTGGIGWFGWLDELNRVSFVVAQPGWFHQLAQLSCRETRLDQYMHAKKTMAVHCIKARRVIMCDLHRNVTQAHYSCHHNKAASQPPLQNMA